MKTYIKQIILTLSLSLVLAPISCEKWIETDFPNNQLPTELVFEDEQTAEAALAGLYASLWSNSLLSGGVEGFGLLGGLYTDDISTVYTPGINGVSDIFYNAQLSNNSVVTNVWTNAYQQIYASNSIIEGVRNSKSLSQAVKDRITGEVLFVRSMLYFYLHQIYGEIPYTDSTDYTVNSQLSRMPQNEFMTRIETDMSEAANLIPANYRNAERIYPNRYAAFLVLAKIKMLLNKNNEAEVLLQTIVQAPVYSFQNDITKVFQKTGSHIIWQLKPGNTNEATKEAILYNFTAAPLSFMVNMNLVSQFSANDLRKQQYITAVPFQTQTNYKISKYRNLAANNPNEYSVIMRLEEAQFLLAEVLIQQGKVSEAIPLINKTRLRAGLSALQVSLTASAAMDELRIEKRKELFAEQGIRFFDLKRWGLLNQLTTVKPNWKAFHVQWPLPAKELLLNPKLNPQNEGY
ncbi:RagB/SusD family nutrient uptake outer membrane protein [Chryseobacterium indoltheticum]|uniref:SusD family n=1 Tax=Chryseobacterium indoltheticum TaxID=254 RepID=A0A381FQZ9_9FLAO|nr:RagB/SusD family nutrient uptake outer membrane protein [Chryseobacterium indoltheticum]SUX48807.1 SusD family [Chryseobacterium indoltheticum]